MTFCSLIQKHKKEGNHRDPSDFSYIDHAVAEFKQHLSMHPVPHPQIIPVYFTSSTTSG